MWFSADVSGVIVGLVSSFLWLLVLFSVKPSLRLTWEEGFASGRWWKILPSGSWRCSPRDTWTEEPNVSYRRTCPDCDGDLVHYRVEVENLGLAKVVEVEVRLSRRVPRAGAGALAGSTTVRSRIAAVGSVHPYTRISMIIRRL